MLVVTNAPSPSSARKYHRWTIGDRLAFARKTITTSQEEFAAMADLSVPTISRYETGPDTYKRNRRFLKTWAEITGFDMAWLLTGIEPSESSGPDDDGGNVVSIKGRRRHSEQAIAEYSCIPHLELVAA